MKVLIWVGLLILFVSIGILIFGVLGVLSPGFALFVAEWILVSRILCNALDKRKLVRDNGPELSSELSYSKEVLEAKIKKDEFRVIIWILSTMIMYSIVWIVWKATSRSYNFGSTGLRIDNWLCTVIWAPITARICK